jgi:putative nucleotidyltransferase with HDIG domain
MKNVIQEIKELFLTKGLDQYGEDVTQQEHAVQCYIMAVEHNASLELRVAAFLHDVGHLMYNPKDGLNVDMKHEVFGAKLLLDWGFGEKVSQLVASHVWAKRYLVSNEPYYINRLSAASLKSFQMQGGLMSDEESSEMRKSAYFTECLNLRRWDDQGKRFDLDSQIPEQVWSDLELCLSTNQSID